MKAPARLLFRLCAGAGHARHVVAYAGGGSERGRTGLPRSDGSAFKRRGCRDQPGLSGRLFPAAVRPDARGERRIILGGGVGDDDRSGECLQAVRLRRSGDASPAWPAVSAAGGRPSRELVPRAGAARRSRRPPLPACLVSLRRRTRKVPRELVTAACRRPVGGLTMASVRPHARSTLTPGSCICAGQDGCAARDLNPEPAD